MKRIWILCMVLLLAVPVLVFPESKKEQPVPEKPAMVEEETMDMDAVDPWIHEIKTKMSKYIVDPNIEWRGLFGEKPVYGTDLVLTNGEVKKIREGKYKIAYIDNNTAGEYTLAIIGGCHEVADYLGMEWVAQTDANFDAAKQKSDVETVLALKPDVVVGYPVDLTTGAETFQPVVDAGIPLVIVSNRPSEYEHGKDFVGISTNNPYDCGYMAGKMMVEGVAKDAEVGILTFSGEYFVLNLMDGALKDAIKEFGPNLTVHEQGYTDWQEAGAIATAMVQKNPNIKAMYATWFDPVMVMAADLKAINRGDIKLYTINVDAPVLVELVDPNGLVKGIASDFPWNVGVNTGILCAYGLLGKEAPEMVVVPSIPITPDSNIRELWNVLMTHVKMPDSLDESLKKLGR
jgi:ribose transport system substrate-binding protein